MGFVKWLVDCLSMILSGFKNSLTLPQAGRQPRHIEEHQERKSQTALRDLYNAKNQPDEAV